MWAAAAMMTAGILLPAGAAAQVSIDAGKTPAQVFASDCQPCHKEARTLSKGPTGLAAFLREHYSASRESAAAMADYLVKVAKGGQLEGGRSEPPPAAHRRGHEVEPGTAATEPGEARPARTRYRGETRDGKARAKPAESKPAETKPAEAKPAETKPAGAEPAATPAEVKPAETAPAEAKPAAAAPAESRPAESAPAAAPAEPKPAEQPAESKPTETTKPADAPPAEPKSSEPKPAE